MKITTIFTALLPIPALILTFTSQVWAKTPNQIAELAIPVTVQINSLAGGGSGVIIAEKNQGDKFTYTVLTADHVVKSAALEYTVRTYAGQNYIATSVEHLQKSENDPDLAIVTFSSENQYPTVPLGNSDQIQIGDKIAIFAYPYLDDGQNSDERLFVYSSGDINTVNAKRPNAYDLLYDATTQKGMSGGPVFNQDGQLIGIHGRGEKVGGEEGKYAFNAAIPINTFFKLEPEYVPNSSNLTMEINNQADLAANGISDHTTSVKPATIIDDIVQPEERYAGASEFYCDVSGANPRTMARNVINKQTKVLINWVGNKEDDDDWGKSAKERCQIVSSKFQQAYYENRLNFLTNGIVNNFPVICATTEMEENCNERNMLLTLRPNSDSKTWIDNFIKGEPQAIRGKALINMSATLAPLLKYTDGKN